MNPVILKKCGFNANVVEVQKWKKINKPLLKEAFEQENTVVLTEDEMILSTQTTLQKIWMPQGENPKIEVSNKKENNC